MRAALRLATSADVDLATYVPAGAAGEESFDVLVCTPLWLRRVVREQGPQLGRHHLIVEPLDLSAAVDHLRRRIESVTGSTWAELAERLARIGHWEFEDYRP